MIVDRRAFRICYICVKTNVNIFKKFICLPFVVLERNSLYLI